ncbi:hypothetical protein KKF55_05925 [Patescibacteria group bacterium]|nr:hypothetical protein [Patescibacteria group bacterium]
MHREDFCNQPDVQCSYHSYGNCRNTIVLNNGGQVQRLFEGECSHAMVGGESGTLTSEGFEVDSKDPKGLERFLSVACAQSKR